MSWPSRCEVRYGPWLAARAAGALSARKTAALARHLARCETCRALAADVETLGAALRQADREQPLAHPAPERLALLATRAVELEANERRGLESHLERCEGCQAEWNVATRWSPGEEPVRRLTRPARPFPPARWRWLTAGAASTAALAALLVWTLLPAPVPLGVLTAPPAGVSPTQLRGSHTRGAGAVTRVIPPRAASDVVISLTVEAAPGADLRIELLGAGGRRLSATETRLSDPAGLLLLSVPAARFPDEGEIRVTVRATGDVLGYPFRAERSGP